MASLENTLLALVLEGTPYSLNKFKTLTRDYKKRSSTALEQPFHKLWTRLIYRNDIDFIKTCGLVPCKGSDVLSFSISYSLNTMHRDTIYAPLFKAMNNLIEDDKIAVEDLEKYIKGVANKKDEIWLSTIESISPFYEERNKKDPYKFRYYALVAQLKFFDNVGMVNSSQFEKEVGTNISYLMQVCPKYVEKTKKLKLKDDSYLNYLNVILLQHKLEKEVVEKPKKKNIKI